jgi:hypothetical protein
MTLVLFIYLVNLMFVFCYLNTYTYYKDKIAGGCNNTNENCRRLKIMIFLNLFTGWVPAWNAVLLFLNLIADHDKDCMTLKIINKILAVVYSAIDKIIDVLADVYKKDRGR